MTERLLTTREIAAFLGMSPESVLRRYRRGELPGYRLSSNVLRFRESEIEAWLEGRRESEIEAWLEGRRESGSEYSPLVSIREEV
jgi:excisionase family DNA binding protein